VRLTGVTLTPDLVGSWQLAAGTKVNFERVLLVKDGEKLSIGQPYVQGTSPRRPLMIMGAETEESSAADAVYRTIKVATSSLGRRRRWRRRQRLRTVRVFRGS
jgi:ribosomal protein L21